MYYICQYVKLLLYYDSITVCDDKEKTNFAVKVTNFAVRKKCGIKNGHNFVNCTLYQGHFEFM